MKSLKCVNTRAGENGNIVQILCKYLQILKDKLTQVAKMTIPGSNKGMKKNFLKRNF